MPVVWPDPPIQRKVNTSLRHKSGKRERPALPEAKRKATAPQHFTCAIMAIKESFINRMKWETLDKFKLASPLYFDDISSLKSSRSFWTLFLN